MSLSTALSIAQSSIRNAGRQTSVVSRNLQEADNPNYNRRIAVLSSTAPGARVVDVQRAANEQLLRQNISALSSWNGQSVLAEGLDRLDLTVNGVDNVASASTAIAKLQESLQLYATSPSNRALAEGAIDAARQVVRSLNDGSEAIQTFRAQADGEIATAVDQLNGLLADFKVINDEIMIGTQAGREVADSLDRRDATLQQIAKLIPISTFTRSDGGMVMTTADGATLFETQPRTISFAPTGTYAAGTLGGKVLVDGVPISAGTGGNTNSSGRIAGLLQLRDSTTPAMQAQLDEVARGLVSAFAETGSGSLPDRPGLFTWPGAPAIPAAGVLVNGLAGSIRVNAAMDSNAGGNPVLLRDGGANGAGYVSNTSGGASYSDLLIAYGNRIDSTRNFDPAAGNGASASITAFASSSIGWLQGLRQDATQASESKQALSMRTAEALSNETGVNVDEEMSLLLDLEHSYQASARLIKTVDDMMASLFAAIG